LASVQLAKAIGMLVIGTAGTEAGMEIVKSQGADLVFNHREENYMEKIKAQFPDGLDIVIEMLANVNLNNDLQMLKWKKGRVVVSQLLKFHSFADIERLKNISFEHKR
jgi:NADPH2:quinone reductase